jgi:hypothetical protein
MSVTALVHLYACAHGLRKPWHTLLRLISAGVHAVLSGILSLKDFPGREDVVTGLA